MTVGMISGGTSWGERSDHTAFVDLPQIPHTLLSRFFHTLGIMLQPVAIHFPASLSTLLIDRVEIGQAQGSPVATVYLPHFKQVFGLQRKSMSAL